RCRRYEGENVTGNPAPSSSKRSRRHESNTSASSNMIAMPGSSAMGTIQAIYDISRDVFAEATPGFAPLPSDVTRVAGFLSELPFDFISFLQIDLRRFTSLTACMHADSLTLQDIGLDATIPYFRADPEGHPKVTYLHCADTPTLSFGVFCLPQSAVIPLHDHPGMTVFSKILLGSMHIKSYDWVKASSDNQVKKTPSGARLAKMNIDATLDASSETVLLKRMMFWCNSRYEQSCAWSGDGQYAWLEKVHCTIKIKGVRMCPELQK
ncbi:Plant cysteine oxidase 1, partial [Dichanthelium oligosanthes]